MKEFDVEKLRKKLKYKLEWGKLATFVPNKNLPIYNWVYFKEGFAKDLVTNLLKMFRLKPGAFVFDPFCGCGTTLLACKELGINSIGYDVLPIAVFASRAKTRDYDLDKLKTAADNLLKIKFRPITAKFPKEMYKFFSKAALQDIAFFKDRIELIPQRDVREFLLLALIGTTIKCSWIWKDGGALKTKKKPVAPIRSMLKRTIQKMIKECKRATSKGKTFVEFGDARRLKFASESMDAIITSPPYLNQIDYTKVYLIENWFVGLPRPGLRSYLGLREAFVKDPVDTYFTDMAIVLTQMWRVCKKGAQVAIVVGNAYMVDKVIESDLIISKIAADIGFKVKQILVLNKRAALRERTKKVGELRESLILMQK